MTNRISRQLLELVFDDLGSVDETLPRMSFGKWQVVGVAASASLTIMAGTVFLEGRAFERSARDHRGSMAASASFTSPASTSAPTTPHNCSR